ncbi:hypothetical protein ACHAWO_009806 [Cyclotella atomus]|uniref:Uncharacterized protein n=1 Tax=Cyclotella atomus TaxID=382360 RepID=A0ABD3QJK0_9STRA
MFSTVVDEIVKQELENEARELETKIAEMKVNLQRSSEPLHTNWDNYQDVEELESNIESAKDQLSKLKGRISRLDNDSLKTCSHRYACQCSGDKRAEREVVAMGTSKRLEEMKSFKEQGNTFFGEKKYREALDLYEKSLIYFEYCFDGTADEQAKADELRLSCLLNAAVCFHHLGMHPRCIEYCNDALEIDHLSIKALFRRARAYRLKDKLDEAHADLMKLKSIVSTKADMLQVEREMELLSKCQREYHDAAKQFAQKAMR